MDARDRRFTRRLLAVAGPAFTAGGFLAAFTDVGAAMVFLGLGMLVTAAGLWTRLPVRYAAAAGVLVTTLLTARMVIELTRH